MRIGCWWRLLAKNRFRVSLSRLHVAVGVSVFTPLNDLLALTQSAIFGRKIAKTEIDKAPIFILGHWRSGTTLLHELLVTDARFASPSTFQCFAPSHFLLSGPLMVRFGGFLLPERRPMDNMAAGWQLPQEDEFALMNLGAPTPYLRIAFPQTQPKLLEYLNMGDVSDEDRKAWRSKFLWFLKVLTFHNSGKQLVLKSPPHTGRISELVAMFPDAKFIHLTRDPCKLYASTQRLWKSLDSVQALHAPANDEAIGEYVQECLTTMYSRFEESRREVDPDRIVDVRYEDLVAEPMETVRSLYERLELGDFSEVEPELKERLAKHGEYQVNRHPANEELRSQVLDMWSDYAERYGYAEMSTATN